MRVRNIFISILMIVLAAYGGTKAYMYFEAKAALDRFFNVFKIAGINVSYDRIATSIFGTIGIQGLKFHFPQIGEDISFGEVIFYRLDQQENSLPTRLRFQMEQVRFNLNFVDKLEKFNKAHGYQSRSQEEEGDELDKVLANLGYSELNQRRNDWRRLGYDNIVMDLAMDFQFHPNLDEASLNMDLDVQKLGDFNIYSDITEAGFRNRMSVLGVKIKQLQIKYRDHSYVNRIIKSYADEHGMDLETYRQQLLKDIDTDFAAKQIKLSPESIQNLKNFISKPDKITISMYPYEPVSVGSLKHYKPGDVPLVLNLRFLMN